MRKITLATFKKFVRENRGELEVLVTSEFNGMTDGVDYHRAPRWVVNPAEDNHVSNTLGVAGVWLVLGSRDRFSAYEDSERAGIKVYNCCGSFIVAVRKAKPATVEAFMADHGAAIAHANAMSAAEYRAKYPGDLAADADGMVYEESKISNERKAI